MDGDEIWSGVWSLVTDDAEGDHVITTTVTHASESAIITHLLPCCTDDARRRKVLSQLFRVGRWDVLDSIFDTQIFDQQHMLIFDFIQNEQLDGENYDSDRLQYVLAYRVLCRCSLDELGYAFPLLVERKFWVSVRVLLQHVIGKTIEDWTTSPTDKFSQSVLWRIAQSHTNVDRDVLNQLTLVTEEFDRPRAFCGIDPTVWSALYLALLHIVTEWCFVCNPVNDVASHVLSIGNTGEPVRNMSDSEVDDLEVEIGFLASTLFVERISDLYDNLKSQTDSALFYDTFSELHAFCVSQIEKEPSLDLRSPISQLLFVKHFVRACFSRNLNDEKRGFMFKVMCSMPFLLKVQNTCLQLLLREKNLNLVLLFDKASMEEGTRRQVFELALEEKRWDVVKKWADQTLPDDQRQQALAAARKLKLAGVVRALEGKSADKDRSETENTRSCDDSMEIERLPDWKAASWRALDPDETDGWTSLHLACFAENRVDDVDKFVDCEPTDNADPASTAQDTAQAESTREEAVDSKEQSESTSTEQVNDENPSTSDNAQAEPKPESDEGTAQPTPGPSGINLGSGNHSGVGENTQQAESQPQTPKPFVMIKYEYRASVINSQTEDGETPLFVASKEGHVEVVRKLLRYKDHIDVNLPDNQGRTPLLIAYEDWHLEVVHELVQYGADVSRPDNQGRTPLSLARERGDIVVERKLLKVQHRAGTSQPDNKDNNTTEHNTGTEDI